MVRATWSASRPDGTGGFPSALLVLIVAAATLEAVFALCIGCKIFALLMRAGVMPASICERCDDIRAA